MFKIIFTLSLSLPHATLSCWLYTSKGLIMTVIISGYVEFETLNKYLLFWSVQGLILRVLWRKRAALPTLGLKTI